MENLETGDAGQLDKGDEGASALVVVPVGIAGGWPGGTEGVEKTKISLVGGRKKGKEPAVGGQVSGDGLVRVLSPKKAPGLGGQPSPKKAAGVGGGLGSPKVGAGPGDGVGSSPGKNSPKMKAKGAAGINSSPGCCWGPSQTCEVLAPGPMPVEDPCWGDLDGVGGKERREAVQHPRGVALPVVGRGSASGPRGPVTAVGRADSVLVSGGRGRKGDTGGRNSRDRGRATGEGRGVAGSPGGSEGVRKERSRSPVGLRQGRVMEQKALGEPGSSPHLGGTTHSERVARLRRAMLGAPSGEGGEDGGGGAGGTHQL